jgi:hypothetical protein
MPGQFTVKKVWLAKYACLKRLFKKEAPNERPKMAHLKR